MTWGGVAAGAGSIIGNLIGGNSQKKAAKQQAENASAILNTQTEKYNIAQKQLTPYIDAGASAVRRVGDLMGSNGSYQQKNYIDSLKYGPKMAALVREGEVAIRQNASATGGLRGGNIQAALAQFRPQILNQLIDEQYKQLMPLITTGQNSAVMTGTAGQNYANSMSTVMSDNAANQARATLAQGQNNANMAQGIGQMMGTYFNRQGNSSGGGSPTPETYAAAQNRS